MRKAVVATTLCIIFILFRKDQNAHCQVINTYAGGGTSQADSIPATQVPLGYFEGIAIDTSGNLYIAVANSNKIRKVNKTNGVITTVVGTGTAGFSGDDSLAKLAQINNPIDIAFDKKNNLYVVDNGNNRIRKINAVSGNIETIAGGGFALGDGGPAVSAMLQSPQGIAIDSIGNVYVSDVGNARVRKIDINGIITTVAGKGIQGFSGDLGQADSAEISSPIGLCIDASGNLYIADWNNKRIRKVSITTGIINTVAGIGIGTYNGDSILATSAYIDPFGIAFDDSGNLFVADRGSNRIRKIDTGGYIYTIAGTGIADFSGDGGLAQTATINHPQKVAFDLCNNLFIADDFNRRVRKITYDSTCNYSNPVDTTDTTTSVRYIIAQNSFSIYPNPAKEQLMVAGGSNNKDVMILNTMGQVMIEQTYHSYDANVNLSGLKTGLYYISVKDKKSGKTVRMKFLKE